MFLLPILELMLQKDKHFSGANNQCVGLDTGLKTYPVYELHRMVPTHCCFGSIYSSASLGVGPSSGVSYNRFMHIYILYNSVGL